jgi:NAD(P)-dependent dehydrogenase (short-subunit alcohol dehydrogenase family)
LNEVQFTVEIDAGAAIEFARLSGDWNPLHTNADYAANTSFGRPVLHGAFLGGLLSRLAGMVLPGEKCLLYGLTLRFIAPVIPPVKLSVVGKLVDGTSERGRVDVRFLDSVSGARYAEGHYEFGLHTTNDNASAAPAAPGEKGGSAAEIVLVTGASGGLARALLTKFAPGTAVGVSRSAQDGDAIRAGSVAEIEQGLEGRRISALVHCAWPAPDNEPLTELADVAAATDFNLAKPIQEIIELAQLLKRHGTAGAALVLIGSTFAEPGRHNFRMPFYTVAKAAIPSLTRVLAAELAPAARRCCAVVFDVLDGGMNRRLTPAGRIAQRDRSPFGRIATMDEAAEQLHWALGNRSFLASGATLVLSGGTIP